MTAHASHAKTLTVVLQGLRRTEPPVTPPVASTARAVSSTSSRTH
ncbi:hypothetical protein ACLF6K_35980 [Streptomyces xanthophaeus]